MSLLFIGIFLTFVLMVQVRDQEVISKIAKRVKALREAKGLTQEQLYNELEIHVGRIESMKVNPTISTINRLCTYFEISLSDFFQDF